MYKNKLKFRITMIYYYLKIKKVLANLNSFWFFLLDKIKINFYFAYEINFNTYRLWSIPFVSFFWKQPEPEPEKYVSTAGYLLAIFKFLMLTHFTPLFYAGCHLAWLNYIDFVIKGNIGRLPHNHEERFALYFQIREKPISEWRIEDEINRAEAEEVNKRLKKQWESYMFNFKHSEYYNFLIVYIITPINFIVKKVDNVLDKVVVYRYYYR